MDDLSPLYISNEATGDESLANSRHPDTKRSSRSRVSWRSVYRSLPSPFQSIITTTLSTTLLAGLLAHGSFHLLTRKKASTGNEQQQRSQTASDTQDPQTSDIYAYIEHEKYGHEVHAVTTEDGFILELIRLNGSRPSTKGVVLMQHGLFQSAGVFVTSGKQSMAFWFVEQGYDVWLGNNRGIPISRHKHPKHLHHGHTDVFHWDWGLDDLAKYDIPAMISYVHDTTGKKIHYVGHSQGTAILFMALTGFGERSNLVKSYLLSFTALAPAAFIGPLKHSAPLKHLVSIAHCKTKFRALFGHHQFLPVMSTAQSLLPPSIFATLAYNMFSYLFEWSDSLWHPDRKCAYFQFTPRPVSVRLISQWMDVAREGRLVRCRFKQVDHDHDDASHMINVSKESLNDCEMTARMVSTCSSAESLSVMTEVYDLARMHDVPVLLFSGGRDFLVDGKRTYEELQNGGKVLISEWIEEYEHMDFLWSRNAQEKVWQRMHETWQQFS